MNYMFASWRRKYITEKKNNKKCVFCSAIEQNEDSVENLIVHRGEHAFLILNRYPYTSGHVMVLPYKHVLDLNDLDNETRTEMMNMVDQTIKALKIAYAPDAFNIGINMGAAAGAGIEAHIHMHVVPRWNGDVNFITSVGDVRILPESLEDSFQKIKNAWDSIL